MTNNQILSRAALCALAQAGVLESADQECAALAIPAELPAGRDYRDWPDEAVLALVDAIDRGEVHGPEAFGAEPLLRRMALLARQTLSGAAESGGALRDLLHRDGRRQREIARLAGIAESSLSLFATGARRPSAATAAKLAAVLACEPEDIRA